MGNLELKNNAKMPLAQPDYVENRYRGWKIRVWRSDAEGVYGCNYLRDGDARYFEMAIEDVRDENTVFRQAERIIDQI